MNKTNSTTNIIKEQKANNYYFANDRKLHNTIMKNNLYSGLPHFAQKVYCL